MNDTPARPPFILDLWRRLPREMGYLLAGLPIAVAGLAVFTTLVSLGLSLVVFTIGLFVLVGALLAARGFGRFERVRLAWAGRPAIAEPVWPVADPQRGLMWRALTPLRDGASWRYLMHAWLVQPIIGIVSWSVTVTWLALGLGGASYWFWVRFIPMTGENIVLHRVVVDFIAPGNQWGTDPALGENVFFAIVGVIALLVLPLITRGLTLVHWGAAVALLSPGRAALLREEVATLAAERGAAVQAEDRSLRRLERDIHDGPQQRLVRLQMDLAAAERRLARDPQAAGEMLAEARTQAHDALEELRALSRGFAPPILQDRGLAAGLRSLAERSPIPVTLTVAFDESTEFAPEIERSVYFVAAELLTNAAKHSGAQSVSVSAAAPGGAELVLRVQDTGVGGAALRDGHGLAGIAERLHGLQGYFEFDSPVGGPTTVTARVPLAAR
ncbi:sensor histidine kinase [Leucobacter sp. HY1910]